MRRAEADRFEAMAVLFARGRHHRRYRYATRLKLQTLNDHLVLIRILGG